MVRGYCNTNIAGIAGVVQQYFKGTAPSNLATLKELDFENFHNNPDAIKNLLIGPHIAFREAEPSERGLICSLTTLAGSGDITFYRSENNGTATDPRANRFSTTLLGVVENYGPIGYDRDATPLGKAFEARLRETNRKLGCSRDPKMYSLGWGGMAESNGISEMLTKLLIGCHTDQNWYDVDDEGNPWNCTAIVPAFTVDKVSLSF